MTLATGIGFFLIIIGLWGMLTQSNMIKIIIGFSIIDTGIHIVMISIGYLKNRTAPILDSEALRANPAALTIDPVPSALVLTAIVIGLAVTALMLTYAICLHNETGTLSINNLKDQA
jgi:multisubunit Na+/H+ antiporter MnhC subunit